MKTNNHFKKKNVSYSNSDCSDDIETVNRVGFQQVLADPESFNSMQFFIATLRDKLEKKKERKANVTDLEEYNSNDDEEDNDEDSEDSQDSEDSEDSDNSDSEKDDN